MDLDEYRQQSRESWARMAPGWEGRREWLMSATAPVNDWLAAKAEPQRGQTVLELAAGTGDLGLRLAERVGQAGRVICSDFAPEMLDVARRNGGARGLSNVDYRVLDAERMDLDGASVDAVVCRWGYMLMADPGAALRETRRVLRGGGPLCFAVWRSRERNPWASVPAATLVQLGHVPPPEPSAPGMFALADEERIASLVGDAGFAERELHEIAFAFRYADFDDVWDAILNLAGPLARALQALPDGERLDARGAIEQSMSRFRNEDASYTAPAASWGVLAR
jgi:ubiquinone/menaquinone biosynthesis C-methylase UbiE